MGVDAQEVRELEADSEPSGLGDKGAAPPRRPGGQSGRPGKVAGTGTSQGREDGGAQSSLQTGKATEYGREIVEKATKVYGREVD